MEQNLAIKTNLQVGLDSVRLVPGSRSKEGIRQIFHSAQRSKYSQSSQVDGQSGQYQGLTPPAG